MFFVARKCVSLFETCSLESCNSNLLFHSILFQRGIYPPESFSRVQKYGLGLFVTSDEALKRFISSVLNQLQEWLRTGIVRKMVLVVSSIEPVEVLERWTFDIQHIEGGTTTTAAPQSKSTKEIHTEIAAVMRQIAASVTFLPLLETACSFDLLMYTEHDAPVPVQWEESAPRYIPNAQHVRLRTVDTLIHKVDTAVAYRCDLQNAAPNQ